MDHSVPIVPVMMGIMIGLALLFAFLGGMVSVVVTGFIQSVIIAFSVVTITIYLVNNAGFDRMHQTVVETFGEKGCNPIISDNIGFPFLILMVLSQILGFASFAPTMQRVASADSPRTAKLMVLLGTAFNQTRLVMIVVWGVATLVAVKHLGITQPDGMEDGMFSKVATAIYLGKV